MRVVDPNGFPCARQGLFARAPLCQAASIASRIATLRALTVLDPTGKAVPMSEILDRGPTVLAFIRHFG
jgi:hypothetical protein